MLQPCCDHSSVRGYVASIFPLAFYSSYTHFRERLPASSSPPYLIFLELKKKFTAVYQTKDPPFPQGDAVQYCLAYLRGN